MNDVDWQQSEKETIEALSADLEFAHKQIRDLGTVVNAQNAMISSLKQRFADHGIKILEKSVVETTREELAEINKSIPAIRFLRAKNPEKLKLPDYEDECKIVEEAGNANAEMALTKIMNIVTDYGGIDLEKHGIDSKTLTFKKGYGPNGKMNFFQIIKRFLIRK